MSRPPERSQGKLLAGIGVIMMIVASLVFASTVMIQPSAQCGEDCALSGLYSTFAYMVSGFNVLVSLALIAMGRGLTIRQMAKE